MLLQKVKVLMWQHELFLTTLKGGCPHSKEAQAFKTQPLPHMPHVGVCPATRYTCMLVMVLRKSIMRCASPSRPCNSCSALSTSYT